MKKSLAVIAEIRIGRVEKDPPELTAYPPSLLDN